jgi:hypothetical protein
VMEEIIFVDSAPPLSIFSRPLLTLFLACAGDHNHHPPALHPIPLPHCLARLQVAKPSADSNTRFSELFFRRKTPLIDSFYNH